MVFSPWIAAIRSGNFSAFPARSPPRNSILPPTVCYGANLSFATPLANAQTGTTMVAGYRFKEYFKYNLLLELFVWLAVVAFMPLFWNLRV